MQEWVDLGTVQWAYAHSQQYSGYTGLEEKFGFAIPVSADGSCTRKVNDDVEILVEFKDERCLTMFLLRWSKC